MSVPEFLLNAKIMKSEDSYDSLKDEVHCLYEEKKDLQISLNKAVKKIGDIDKENKELYKRIDDALYKIQYIIDYGFDYDGFGSVERLKGLIDMLVDYARETKDILLGNKNE